MNRELKRGIILVVIIVVIVVAIKFIQGFDTTKRDLKKLGYSKEDANVIVEKLNEEEINTILGLEYNDKLIEILNQQYYIPKNLLEYIEFAKEEEDLTKVISKVNVGANKSWYTEPVETDLTKEYAILVNKFHYLTSDFSVDDLVKVSDWYAYAGHTIRSEVYNSYVSMWKAAKEQNLTILVTSSFRTYANQEKDFKTYGDDYAARPGHSEHQTGLALDISTYDTEGNVFDQTDEFKWLKDNAHKYGFILRYPNGKEDITGYAYESWHYRYLGTDLATKVYNSNLTYDEYYAYYCDYKGEC